MSALRDEEISMKNSKFIKQNLFKLIFAFVIFGAIIFSFPFFEKVQAEMTDAKVKTEKETALENSLYSRTEFFQRVGIRAFPD